MTQQSITPKPADPEDPQLAANVHLKRIEEHLRSIREMLAYFVILSIVVIIIQFFT